MAYTDIDKSDDYFNTVLYTGNESSRSITGVNFQPDWVWIKCRSASNKNVVYDINRGATKELSTNTTDAEVTETAGLTSFNSDGLSLGNRGEVNQNGQTFVSWNWLAANGTASNSDGSIPQLFLQIRHQVLVQLQQQEQAQMLQQVMDQVQLQQ